MLRLVCFCLIVVLLRFSSVHANKNDNVTQPERTDDQIDSQLNHTLSGHARRQEMFTVNQLTPETLHLVTPPVNYSTKGVNETTVADLVCVVAPRICSHSQLLVKHLQEVEHNRSQQLLGLEWILDERSLQSLLNYQETFLVGVNRSSTAAIPPERLDIPLVRIWTLDAMEYPDLAAALESTAYPSCYALFPEPERIMVTYGHGTSWTIQELLKFVARIAEVLVRPLNMSAGPSVRGTTSKYYAYRVRPWEIPSDALSWRRAGGWIRRAQLNLFHQVAQWVVDIDQWVSRILLDNKS